MKKRLSLVISGQNSNCFVGLPVQITTKLFESAEKFPLPLCLRITWDAPQDKSNKRNKAKKTAFVGWAGDSSKQPDTLEIGTHLASCLSLLSDDTRSPVVEELEISFVPSSRIATVSSVQVEPKSPDDWEILSLNAEYMEQNILSQLAFLAPDQCFPLFLHRHTAIYLHLVATDPIMDSATYDCLRLTNGCEVAVAPKQRSKAKDQTKSFFVEKPTVLLRSLSFSSLPDSDRTRSLLLSSGHQHLALVNSSTLKDLNWPSFETVVRVQPLFRTDRLNFSSPSSSKLSSSSSSSDLDASPLPTQVQIQTAFAHLVVDDSVAPDHVVLSDAIFFQMRSLPFSQTMVTILDPARILPVSQLKQTITLRPLNLQSAEKQAPKAPSDLIDSVQRSFESISPPLPFAFIYSGQTLSFTHKNKTTVCIVEIKDDSADGTGGGSRVLGNKQILNDPVNTKLFRFDLSAKDPFSRFQVETSLASPNHQINIFEGPRRQTEDQGLRFSQLGSVEKVVSSIWRHIDCRLTKSLTVDRLFARSPVPPMLILHGPSGCGKSTLLRSLQHELSLPSSPFPTHCSFVEGSRFSMKPPETIAGEIEKEIALCKMSQPSVLIIDDVHQFFSLDAQSSFEPSSEQTAALLYKIITSLNKSKNRVAVIASSRSLDAIPSSLRNGSGVMATNRALLIPSPDRSSREELFSKIATLLETQIDSQTTIEEFAKATEGYVASDILQLLERAKMQQQIRTIRGPERESVISQEDLKIAKEGFVPLSLKGVQLHQSQTEWKDIGGLLDVRSTLKETFEWPSKYPQLFANSPIKLRHGLMLFGPPGCGKTLLASAVAKECGLNFISVKGPEVLNKYIGASEQAVRDLFDRARAASPCILFFDEFEAIAPRRGHDNTGVTDRVVNQLLTELDGVEGGGAGSGGCFVLAASSRPDLIDPALLRPGRIDKSLYCRLPDQLDRLLILKAVSRKSSLAHDVDLSFWASRTEGFTGADLQAFVYNAQLEAIHSVLDSSPLLDPSPSSSSSSSPSPSLVVAKESPIIVEPEGSSMEASTRSELLQSIAAIQDTEERAAKGPAELARNEESGSNRPRVQITSQHLTRSLETTSRSLSSADVDRYEAIYANFSASRNGNSAHQKTERPTGRATLA